MYCVGNEGKRYVRGVLTDPVANVVVVLDARLSARLVATFAGSTTASGHRALSPGRIGSWSGTW